MSTPPHRITVNRSTGPCAGMLAIVLILLTAGCASTPPQNAAELQTKDGHARAVVLLRVLTEIDGRTLPAFPAAYALDSLWLGLGDFSSGGKLRVAPLAFFSKKTRLDGWTYLLLEPGLYYLGPHPPQNENSFAYDRSWRGMTPCWRLEIPRDAGVIYAGTLFIPGRGMGQIFGGRRLQAFDRQRFEVRDETIFAERMWESWLKGLGRLATRLVTPHAATEPLILETPPGR